MGHTCVPTDGTATSGSGSGADDGSSDSSTLAIALVVAACALLVCALLVAWVVVKRRANNLAAASRTAATFANPTYAGLSPEDAGNFTAMVNGWQQADSSYGEIRPLSAGDADLEGTYGEIAPLPSDGGAGRTSSSTLHSKGDDDLDSGYGDPEKEAGYFDVAPAIDA